MQSKIRLNDVPLFQFLRKDHVPLLNECAVSVQKKAQEAIIMEGEDVLGIYVVANGQVHVHSGLPNQPITLIHAGEAFGEMSMIENASASATIRAASDETRLIFIHGKRLQEKLDANPEMATAFYRGVATVLSKRLRSTTRQASEQILKNQILNETLLKTSPTRPLSGQCHLLRQKLSALSSFIGSNTESQKLIQESRRQIRDVETTTEHLEKLVQSVEKYLFTL